MASNTDKEFLQIQILETEKMLLMIGDHPLMKPSFMSKLSDLKNQLADLLDKGREAAVKLLFSGKPVVGSLGIDVDFLSKAVLPFQKMVSADVAAKLGRVGKRGVFKGMDDSKLYLTALPKGSFGVELKKINNNNLFDEELVADALSHVCELINSSTQDDETFAHALGEVNQRIFSGLRQFLKVVSEEDAALNIESQNVKIELSNSDLKAAFNRVSAATTIQRDIEVSGILKGLLLESGRFDFIDDALNKITGAISAGIKEEVLTYFNEQFFNKHCIATFFATTVSLNSGKSKTSYVLTGVKSATNNNPKPQAGNA